MASECPIISVASSVQITHLNGYPKCLSFDRGTVFYDNTTTSPFPTHLHLWLLALGIEVHFTRVRRPTDHAKVERLHQTMTLQALLGQTWPDAAALWAGLDIRRRRLNEQIPCRMLGGRAPLEVYPEAQHSGRFYRPEWELDMLDLARVYTYLATCRWFRRVAYTGAIALGGVHHRIDRKYAEQAIEITFDAERAVFVGYLPALSKSVEFVPRHLTKEALMGEFSMLAALPAYQLALPFTHEAQRVMDYTPMRSGITL